MSRNTKGARLMSDQTPWRWMVIGVLAAAALIVPALAVAQSNDILVNLDVPVDGVTLTNGQNIEFKGWAVDTTSANGPGVDSVEITIINELGFSQRIFANYGLPRPDVAQALGRPDWAQSGFFRVWPAEGLAEGSNTIQVWAQASTGISRSASVGVTGANPPPV